MPFCTTCGTNATGAFCPSCGKPVLASGGAAAPPPQYGSPQQYGAPPRKGMSPVAIILLVIGGLFMLGIIAVAGAGYFFVHKVKDAAKNPGLAIAKMVTMSNPELQVLNTNDSNGTITVRDRNTGKVTTMKFDDVKNGGKFTITADDDKGGKATVQFGGEAGKLPAWVPQYPGSTPKSTYSITGSSADGNGGNFTFTTSDSASKVLDFYGDKIKDAGMKVTSTTTTPDGGMVSGTDDSGEHTLIAIVGNSSGQTTVNVTYGLKKK
jgi:hypothetical protein